MFEKLGEPRTIELNAAGKFDDRYAPGVFAVMLKDGNGGQSEYSIVSVYRGYSSYINFIGHAVSFTHKEKKSDDCIAGINIVSAEYGILGENCKDVVIVDKEAYDETVSDNQPWDEVIIDIAAYDEIITDTPAWDEITQISSAHTEYRYWIPTKYSGDYSKDDNHYHYLGTGKAEYDVTFINVGHVHHPAVPGFDAYYTVQYVGKNNGNCNKVTNSGNDWNFKVDGEKYKIVGNGYYQYTLHPAVKSSNAWVEYFGDYSIDDDHYHYAGLNKADYDVFSVVNTKVEGHWSEWSDVKPHCDYQTRVVPAVTGVIHHPAVTHVVHHNAVTHVVHHESGSHVVHHPAVTHIETICEVSGSHVDVTQQVSAIIASETTSFLFDNRPSPGGIFAPDGVTLISQIEDPAPGQVKTTHIVYNNGCGSENVVVTANEYETISIGEKS
jgi:hypothetical protein